jgi:A/G-specific adenine glycosylase
MKQSAMAAFRKAVYGHFAAHGRDLPWRRRVTPYAVFVSEMMLQQTQVSRVAVLFPRFVRRFPGWKRLAEAPLKEVLDAWRGLGYTRRAKYLHDAARIVAGRYHGRLPRDPETLTGLPGIGAATAASIAAFAFNRPTAFVETNIRAAFIHHFFPDGARVPDAAIRELAETALDIKNPRRWYSALMDYGTHVKKEHKNPARRAAIWKAQGKFEGSNRQARGRALALVVAAEKPVTAKEVAILSGLAPERVAMALLALAAEGLIKKRRGRYSA